MNIKNKTLAQPKLIRLTTVPISLRLLLTGQMRYMQEQGFEVLMVSANGPEREIILKTEDCPHYIIPFTRAITPFKDLQCLWLLLRLMRRERPLIVHTHTPKAGLLGMLAARLTGVPIRIHTIAGLPFMTASGGRRKLLMAMERLTYWGAQHVWPNSQSIMAYVKRQKLCPERKLSIIGKGSTNGIALNQFSMSAIQADKLSAIKMSFSYHPDNIYILAVGRMVKDKGIPELVAAFQALRVKQEKLRLLLIGPLEKERPEELLPKETLTAIREDEDVTHIHWTDDVADYMYLADVLVHASHREGFPNVLLQAGAMRLPIVCSSIPGNIDIVQNEQTGICFPVGETKALTDSLQYALEHPEKTKRMAEALYKRIEKYFERQIVHQTLLKKYRALIDRSKL